MLKNALKNIHISPIAAESMGTRSMCTFVETSDVRVLLDAGVALCPRRFGLPPHPDEYKAINESRRKIAEAAGNATVVTLSHYHFDHHTPSYEDWLTLWTETTETARQIYDGKTVLVKNPRENVNDSQRRRGWMFTKTGGSYAKKLEMADGKTFAFGHTIIKFSDAVFHGSENSFLGWVLMTAIESRGEKFMFAPDVQGPVSVDTTQAIMREEPQVLMLGGPPLYLAGFKVDEKQMQVALANMQRIVECVPVTIVEHHVLRDENWNQKLSDVFYAAYKSDHVVLTAAEFLDQPNCFLEASRKDLYARKPPSREFQGWMKKSVEAQKRLKPPI